MARSSTTGEGLEPATTKDQLACFARRDTNESLPDRLTLLEGEVYSIAVVIRLANGALEAKHGQAKPSDVQAVFCDLETRLGAVDEELERLAGETRHAERQTN